MELIRWRYRYACLGFAKVYTGDEGGLGSAIYSTQSRRVVSILVEDPSVQEKSKSWKAERMAMSFVEFSIHRV